jgi:hypothetical protein
MLAPIVRPKKPILRMEANPLILWTMLFSGENPFALEKPCGFALIPGDRALASLATSPA